MSVLILVGIPGSGKSTYAKTFEKALVLSADDFFNTTGEYKFDPAMLGHAHGYCLRRYIERLRETVRLHPTQQQTFIVDNTNSTLVEMAPYIAAANAYGIPYEVHVLRCTQEMALARNIHNVPADVIEKMAVRINTLQQVYPAYWNAPKYL